jgi:lipopolysaccharide transport system ATP-binding protein
MSNIAIRVENLSKLYKIGARRNRHDTLRDHLAHGFKSLFSRNGRSSFPASQPSTVSGHPSSADGRSETIWALKDVSFEVKQGEVVGIIGRNGAGKSTLFKILSRITEPTSGFAEIHGRVSSLLEVGTGFHPELTGRENIYLNAAILGMKKAEIEEKFEEIVDFSEIEKFIDTPVKRYSSGMYVRLAFAVAAHLEPEILIVDEVLAVGDLAFQKKCLGKMDDVARAGRTVLFVSHSMEPIRKLCTKAILLENGVAQMTGPTDVVIDQYLASGVSETSSFVKLPQSSPGVPGEARCLVISGEDGLPKAQFRLGESWRIALYFEIRKPTEHVIAAVGLMTIDSLPIITYWSEPKDLSPGQYVVGFECDLPLQKCELQFTVGLSSYEKAFHFVQGVGRVSISEIAVGKQPVRVSGTGLLYGTRVSEIAVATPEALNFLQQPVF